MKILLSVLDHGSRANKQNAGLKPQVPAYVFFCLEGRWKSSGTTFFDLTVLSAQWKHMFPHK